jgi:hypothetical protein
MKKMQRVKKFFRISEPYKFEWNDLRCLAMIINVVLIMFFGLSISWFGLGIALVGIVKDLTSDRHVSGLLMHLASVALNVYFLFLLYGGAV